MPKKPRSERTPREPVKHLLPGVIMDAEGAVHIYEGAWLRSNGYADTEENRRTARAAIQRFCRANGIKLTEND